MVVELLVYLTTLAFLCEYIDSSLGMGYGTILSPVLIVLGFDPLLVVPSVLISQSLGGFAASLFHHRFHNIHITRSSKDSKVILLISVLGVAATIFSVLIAVSIPAWALKAYIGVLVMVMGILLLSGIKLVFSWRNIAGVGLISAFNKGLSGGGFGPVVTAGQVISGQNHKNAIGCTTAAEAPICLAGFLTYAFASGLPEMVLILPLCIGAMIAAPFGALTTKKMDSRKLKLVIGALVFILGLWVLLKLVL
jgi:uncharacterized membrane protein YfcA